MFNRRPSSEKRFAKGCNGATVGSLLKGPLCQAKINASARKITKKIKVLEKDFKKRTSIKGLQEKNFKNKDFKKRTSKKRTSRKGLPEKDFKKSTSLSRASCANSEHAQRPLQESDCEQSRVSRKRNGHRSRASRGVSTRRLRCPLHPPAQPLIRGVALHSAVRRSRHPTSNTAAIDP